MTWLTHQCLDGRSVNIEGRDRQVFENFKKRIEAGTGYLELRDLFDAISPVAKNPDLKIALNDLLKSAMLCSKVSYTRKTDGKIVSFVPSMEEWAVIIKAENIFKTGDCDRFTFYAFDNNSPAANTISGNTNLILFLAYRFVELEQKKSMKPGATAATPPRV